MDADDACVGPGDARDVVDGGPASASASRTGRARDGEDGESRTAARGLEEHERALGPGGRGVRGGALGDRLDADERAKVGPGRVGPGPESLQELTGRAGGQPDPPTGVTIDDIALRRAHHPVQERVNVHIGRAVRAVLPRLAVLS